MSRQADRRLEASHLAALAQELAADTALLGRMAAGSASAARDAGALLAVLRGEAAPSEAPPVAMTLVQASGDRRVPLQVATYRDLVATGHLRLIRDRSLRSDVVAYYARGELLPVMLDRLWDRSAGVCAATWSEVPPGTLERLYAGPGPSPEEERALVASVRAAPHLRAALETFPRETIVTEGVLDGHRAAAAALLDRMGS